MQQLQAPWPDVSSDEVRGNRSPASDVFLDKLRQRRDVIPLKFVQRLDAMLYAVWDDVLQGDANAVHTALKISGRRSRLLGLDALHTVEARARVHILSWNQAIRYFVDSHDRL